MRRDDRGQTLYDFALGMAIFLLLLGYVFAFVPSLFEPFSPIEDSTAIRADRTADTLVHTTLAKDDARLHVAAAGVLSTTCTRTFFNGSSPPADCQYATTVTDQSDIRDLTGLPDRTDLNVTMRRNSTIRSYEGDRLAAGPEPNLDSRRVIRATRIVQLDGTDYQFAVRLW